MPHGFESLLSDLWVAQSRLYHTNSGVFASHRQACLVDPGIYPDEIEAMVTLLQSQSLYPQTLILTHSHWDHVLGPEYFPDVKIMAHINFVDEIDRHGQAYLKTIARVEQEQGIRRDKPFQLPQPNVLFNTSTSLQIGMLMLELLHVPGHASDQLAIYVPDRGILWASDILSDLEIPLISDSLTAYEATLARLAQLDIKVLIPGHGSATSNPAEIQQRLSSDRIYMAAVRAGVEAAISAGQSIDEAVAACAAIPYRQPQENVGAHRLNIESVYLELGGQAPTGQVGWSQEVSQSE
jgi:glyoxylase-like metal-dependent hydrolase (beta-lactamase superfamily II)